MSERDFDVLWAFSTKKQTAYGTKLADVDLTLATPFKGPDAVVRTPTIETDAEQAGRGQEFQQSQEIERWDVRLARSFDMTSLVAAWVSAFGLGQVTTSQPDAGGNPTVYDHQCRFMTNTKELPVTSIVENPISGTTLKSLYRDMAIADFEMSGEINQRLQLAANLIGSGYREASTKTIPSVTAGSFLRMSGVTFQVGPTGSEVDVSSRIKGFTLGVNNNPMEDDGYFPGSGLYRGRLEYGQRREVELAFQLLVADAVERDHLEANDYLKAIITSVGAVISTTYKHTLTITVPRLAYRALPIGFEDGMALYSIEANVFHDSSSGYPLDITVRNNTAALLN
ncbi:phage tail tube protein [Nitrospinae bacterium AH_259_B05_G02_I21]|nr:phage tail tube protein [Nitrospinae bacterium AH_259_B05_G02_I21]